MNIYSAKNDKKLEESTEDELRKKSEVVNRYCQKFNFDDSLKIKRYLNDDGIISSMLNQVKGHELDASTFIPEYILNEAKGY